MQLTYLKAFFACLALAMLTACGGGSSTNVAPVANAGAIQNVVLGSTVTLDGSGSDANGDTLTYVWTLTTPAGSTAKLSASTSPKPTFTPDVAGTYVATLFVDDGKLVSATSSVTVTVTAPAVNAAPVANAGSAQNVVAGTVVTLDGSASSDANGDTLFLNWTLTGKPTGSAASLSSTASAKPTFTADVAGTYVASLVVSDGKTNSNTATVAVTAFVINAAPVADAGSAQNVVVGSLVTLDGSKSSDANGDSLSYSWTLTSKPTGSVASLNSAASIKPTFTADVAGTYVASLVVNDGKINSNTATVAVTASVVNVAPVADAGSAQNAALGSLVTLDGSKSSDANGDALSYGWTLTSKPAGSAAVLSSATLVKPTFVADAIGTYVATLLVNDGKLSSTASTVAISVTTPTIVINKTEPVSGLVQLSLSDSSAFVKVSWYLDLVLKTDTSWDTSASTDGTHLISAKAQRSDGSYIEIQRSVVVHNLSHNFYVGISADATRVPGIISVYVTATEQSGVPKAEAFFEGTSIGVLSAYNYCSLTTIWCSAQNGPINDMYLFTKDGTQIASGTYTVSVVVTAKTGETKTASFSLVVSTPPRLSLIAPADGATVSGTLRVVGSSSTDKTGVVTVTAKLGDYQFMSTTNPNFDGTMSVSGLAPGSYTLTVTATDSSNAATVITRTVKVGS